MTTKDSKVDNTERLTAFTAFLTGALLGLAVISVFVFGGEPDSDWPQNWQIKPMLLTPFISGMGGLFLWLLLKLTRTGFNKILATTIGVIGFFIFLWIGLVLGLNGTMWD